MTPRNDADPVYVHSLREAYAILGLWTLSFLWTVPYCYFRGYSAPADPDQVAIVLGMPDWVAWGVAVPWFVCGVISILMCLFMIRDDDLGLAGDEAHDEPAAES